jgi:ankyrin repeat protein
MAQTSKILRLEELVTCYLKWPIFAFFQDGFTPLRRAANMDNVSIAGMLLKKGANIEAVGNVRFTITAFWYQTIVAIE